MRVELLADIHVVGLNPAEDVQSELIKIARPVKSILWLESGQVLDLMAQILDDAFAFHFITPDTQIGFVTVFRRFAFLSESPFQNRIATLFHCLKFIMQSRERQDGILTKYFFDKNKQKKPFMFKFLNFYMR